MPLSAAILFCDMAAVIAAQQQQCVLCNPHGRTRPVQNATFRLNWWRPMEERGASQAAAVGWLVCVFGETDPRRIIDNASLALLGFVVPPKSESGRTKVQKRDQSKLTATQWVHSFHSIVCKWSNPIHLTSHFFLALALARTVITWCVRFKPKFITETESLLIICNGAAHFSLLSALAHVLFSVLWTLLPFELPHYLEYFMRWRCPSLWTGNGNGSMRNMIQFRIWRTAYTWASI